MMTATTSLPSVSMADLLQSPSPELAAVTVRGLALDSRVVKPGDLFIALAGHDHDGRHYIDQAIERGALAVVVDGEGDAHIDNQRVNIPVIATEKLATKVSAIAGRFYNDPSARMNIFAVTGTNGKTSCTQFLMQLLNILGQSCGVIGTLGNGIDGHFSATPNTTPDAISIQSTLANWLDSAVANVAMEVSSHGLDQYRVESLTITTAIFTNLSRDHLDYHGDMQSYGRAKLKLFRSRGLQVAVINADDPFSADVKKNVAAAAQVFSYSLKDSRADVWVEQVVYSSAGVTAQLNSPWGTAAIQSPLLGAFNLSNVLAVVVALLANGYSLKAVVAAVARLKPIAGRMQRVAFDSDVDVVIDYAHTPDALENALLAMRQHCRGQLWCVFGCGGDRDRGKRPLMGSIAARLADRVVVTSDNPRHEPADQIIADILAGIDGDVVVQSDRSAAIFHAIVNALSGDSILVAGKGHEQYQQLGDARLPFDDCKQSRLALAARASR